MNAEATECNSIASIPSESVPVKANVHRSARYQKVLDGRKQPIRGLWSRNGRFVARITDTDNTTGRKSVKWVPLKGAHTVPQAQAELRRLLTLRDRNELPVLKRAPKLADYIEDYLSAQERLKAKRPATLAAERCKLKLWADHCGETRLHALSVAQVNAFREKRIASGVSPRTVNLDVIALRNVLNRAIDEKWIKGLPIEDLRPLKWTARKRDLVPWQDIEKLCLAASEPRFVEGRLANDGEQGQPLRNAQQFADYVKLMAFCGSRRDETLRLKWSDVDFTQRQLHIGSDGLTKNYERRVVDFNEELEAHLVEMQSRRVPDSQYLFPSPQRGSQDMPAKTFRESLELARAAAEMPAFGFHDCRHFFISRCVMSGIDYLTIAKWVGHKDGGVLIGKVYGHLADEHRREMAQRLAFAPRVVDASLEVSAP